MSEQLQLATLEWGTKGPRALLIHGLTSSARSWWRLGAEMARLVRDRRDGSLVLAE